jgi:hypothetical protein
MALGNVGDDPKLPPGGGLPGGAIALLPVPGETAPGAVPPPTVPPDEVPVWAKARLQDSARAEIETVTIFMTLSFAAAVGLERPIHRWPVRSTRLAPAVQVAAELADTHDLIASSTG